MPVIDDLIRRIGRSAADVPPSKFQAMLAARREFTGAPASQSHLLPAPNSIGTYYGGELRHAVWRDGDNATRRHEVMHGILDATRRRPELRSAAPAWARWGGDFADELLARIAGGKEDLLDWPMKAYFHRDPLKYAVAMPIHSVAREAVRNPDGLIDKAMLAGAATTAGVQAASLLNSVRGAPQPYQPEELPLAEMAPGYEDPFSETAIRSRYARLAEPHQ